MFNDLNIIVLSGGFGTRITSTIGKTPKILAPIEKKPFLDYFLDWLKPLTSNEGVSLTFSLHHNHNPIINYIERKKVNCNYVIDEEAYGTFGAVCNSILKYPKEKYLILNGDTIFDADLKFIYKQFLKDSKLPLLILKHQSFNNRFGGYVMENKKFSYCDHNSNLISLGAYFITHKELTRRWQLSTKLAFSLDNLKNYHAYPLMNDENCLGLEPINGFCLEENISFVDIGIKESFLKAQKEVPSILKSYN